MALPHCICNILCIWRNLYFYLYCICIASGLNHASNYGATRIAYYEAGKASVGRGSWAFGGAQKNPTSLLYASTHSRTQINQCALSSRTSCECRFIFATPPWPPTSSFFIRRRSNSVNSSRTVRTRQYMQRGRKHKPSSCLHRRWSNNSIHSNAEPELYRCGSSMVNLSETVVTTHRVIRIIKEELEAPFNAMYKHRAHTRT